MLKARTSIQFTALNKGDLAPKAKFRKSHVEELLSFELGYINA
jgi:hypothetical protein